MTESCWRSPIATVVSLIVAALNGCASLPPLDGRPASKAMTDTADTQLGLAVQAGAAAHPGKSGIYPLDNPKDAFAARALLVRAAQRSLDVQYYIWHTDTTGYLLLEQIWNAAERGVRVRLLLDDNGIAGLDSALAVLDAHDNIEVRLFNPFVNRGFKTLGYLTDFSRLNRRMHNKSLTADAQATIVGGRNVGDEYFGAARQMIFADLDVLAVGPIAAEVGVAFDAYWDSDSAYPAHSIIRAAPQGGAAALRAKLAAVHTSPEATGYIEALRQTRLVEQLVANDLPLDWAPVKLVYDEPTKGLGEVNPDALLLTRMQQALGQPQREIDIISPYFVPGKKGTAALSAFPQRGVRLRILTNSLAANDVAAVHAGYAKYRAPLLRGGATLYELKPSPSAPGADGPKKESGGNFGSSSASLHAKTFSVDRSRVFIGSFNLDPRSVQLNTEMGLVIESPQLAEAISEGLDRSLERAAYAVVLDPAGDLAWVEHTAQGEVRYSTEPATSFSQRLGADFLSLLPIEWLL